MTETVMWLIVWFGFFALMFLYFQQVFKQISFRYQFMIDWNEKVYGSRMAMIDKFFNKGLEKEDIIGKYAEDFEIWKFGSEYNPFKWSTVECTDAIRAERVRYWNEIYKKEVEPKKWKAVI